MGNERLKRKRAKMEGQMILVLVLAIPVILFPAAFVWYLNIGGIYHAIQEAQERRAAQGGKTKEVAQRFEQPVEK